MDTSFLIDIVLILIVIIVGFGLVIWKRRKRSDKAIVTPSNYKKETELEKHDSKTSRQDADIVQSNTVEPDNVSQNEEQYQIFISYRRDDSSDITGRIYDRLIQHFGTKNIFKDVDSIPLGVDFKKHLDLAVAQCSTFLVVIGPDWLGSTKSAGENLLSDPADFVRIELESAFSRGILTIPLFVRKATMPVKEDLPEIFQQLLNLNGINIRPDPDFHIDMGRLIRAIENHPIRRGKD